MKISVTFRNAEGEEWQKEYVEERLMKLKKYIDHPVDARVILSVEKFRNTSDINLTANGLNINGKGEEKDMHLAIDNAIEKIERQLNRYKTKIEKRHTKESVRFPDFNQTAFQSVEPEADELDEPKIVRIKSFELKPMTEEEAILQLELLGHDFYVFEDLSGVTSVIYKRKDGNYGLIERATV